MKYSKELKAGLVVLVTLISFWMVFLYLKGKDVFSKGNMYYVNYANVDGLETTKPVTINGLRVGKVEEIQPVPGANGSLSFKVKISVGEEYSFNKASVAEIYAPDIMSGKQIKIVLSDKPPLAKNNDELKGVVNPSITDVLGKEVAPLKNQINTVVNQLDSTLVVTEAVMKQVEAGNLTATLNNTNRTLSSFKTASDKASTLLEKNTDEINALLRDANFIMAGLNKTIQKYGSVADKVNGLEVEQSLQSLQTTMGKLNQFLDNLNNDQGTLSKLMTDPSLYNNLNQTSESLNSLLEDMKDNPKRYVNISVFGKK